MLHFFGSIKNLLVTNKNKHKINTFEINFLLK